MKKRDRTLLILLLLLILAWRFISRKSKSANVGGSTGDKFNEATIGVQPTATHTTAITNNGNGNGNGTIGLGNTGISGGMPSVPGCTLFGCTDPLALNYYPGACADSPATPCCYSYNDCCDKGIYSPSVCGE